MTEQDKESTLSEAYVNAIAARAGANISFRRRDYGIDGSFHEVADIDGERIECGATIDYQLKASQRCILRDTEVLYDLKKDAYNRLVTIKTRNARPCILLLLHLPTDSKEWFTICEDYLQIRKCCYWLYWKEIAKTNQSSVRIRIPRIQQFTPDTLNMLFECYSRGELL